MHIEALARHFNSSNGVQPLSKGLGDLADFVEFHPADEHLVIRIVWVRAMRIIGIGNQTNRGKKIGALEISAPH